MSERRLFVLGTSSQVPTRYRNHNGYLLDWEGRGILFDPGEGIQRQMLLAGLPASRIHHICITHFHGDHCLGLAGIIQRLSLDRVTRPIQVYYPASGQVYLDRLRQASIFVDVTQLVLVPITTPGILYCDERFQIETEPLDHTVESWGFRLREHDRRRLMPDRLTSLGLEGAAIGRLQREGLFEQEGRRITLEQVSEPLPGQSFAFVMDTRTCEGALSLARRADMLVCEATYLSSESREASEYGHMTATQAAVIARDAGVDQLVLTHFSQRYETLDPFLEEAGQIHHNVCVARDGDVFSLPPKRLHADRVKTADVLPLGTTSTD